MVSTNVASEAQVDHGRGPETLTPENHRIQHAITALRAKGLMGGGGSTKVSARLDVNLLAAARAKIGSRTDTELLTAALVLVAGGDDFGTWLATRGERLPADFELEF